MCKHVLVLEEGLEGQYVATPSFCDTTVVAHGPDLVAVIKEAEDKGVSDPVLIFVPQNDVSFVY